MPGPISTDSNFERTFSDIAYARLQDKAPTLLDYLVGFQLIDKNDDETHAVGVFGFKIGSEWIYAPVFFINGELKGHELLYIKSQDSFVPLTEEWTNYILNRRPAVLGERESTPRNLLPIRQPDFDVFARAPYIGSKYAGDKKTYNKICRMLSNNPDSEWAVGFMSNFLPEKQANVNPRYKSLNKRFDIPYVLRTFGKQAVANLVGTMRKHSDFADAILKFYDFKKLADFEKAAEKMSKEEANYQENGSYSNCQDCQNFTGAACAMVDGDISSNGTCKYFQTKTVENIEPISPAGGNPLIPKEAQEDSSDKYKVTGTAPEPVVIVRGDDPSNVMHGMSDSDKEKLLQNNYVVKDERSDDQRSRLYKTQINQTYQSPTENGYYEIISDVGQKRNMVVVVAPKNVGTMNNKRCMVIDPENGRFGTFYTSDLLISKRLENGEWDKDFESNFGKLNALNKDDIGALVGPQIDATLPFRVEDKQVNSEGQTEMRVSSFYCGCSDKGLFHGSREEHEPYAIDQPGNTLIDKIVLTGKDGRRANIIGSTIFIPNTWKSINLPKEFRYTMGGTLDLPSLPDVVLNLYKTAMAGDGGIKSFKLRTDGIGYSLEQCGKRGPSMTKLSMLRHLICEQGLGQEDAEYTIKEAAPQKAKLYFIKYALGNQPQRAVFPEPIMSEDPDLPAKVTYPMLEIQNLGDIDNQDARMVYAAGSGQDRFVDPSARRNAIDASNQGQKEVLDTAVISGLVKTLDTSNLVDSYIGDLLLGLDRIGRILFLFYWHNDKFKDRYGQQDLIELEDNLRNVFENLGELSLFLKQKTIEPAESNSSEVQLTDVMG